MSHPAWGAWIEVQTDCRFSLAKYVSHPAWGAWIEVVL